MSIRILIPWLIALCATVGAVQAEEIVGGLSQDRVSITANFDGSEIFVFGAVKRDTPVPPDAGALEIVITVRGPSEPLMVRRKERAYGIWINRDAVEIDAAPSFYTIASTGPLDEIMSKTEQLRQRLGFEQAVRLVGAPAEIGDPEAFKDAVIRINRNNGLYAQREGIVELQQDTLFNTSIRLPANLTEGDYLVRMFLLRDRQVTGQLVTTIFVRKEGLERIIYTMAHERPLLYGILSIAVALLAGWSASEAFRLLRR